MKAIILDGSQANDITGGRVRAAVMSKLQTQGYDVDHLLLREKKIGNCAGDFFCWVRNPGMCNTDDDNREIAEAIVQSDLLVYLTLVTFGGYSSVLKRAVDHQIQNIKPFFAQVNGETHHQKRYARYADFLAIGWMEQTDSQAEAVFRYLTQRNGVNFYAKKFASGVVLANQTDGEIQAAVQGWLTNLQNDTKPQATALPKKSQTGSGAIPIRRALLLVGSPRTRKSSSQSLGGYLFEQLSARQIQTETIYIHTTMRSAERTKALLEAVEGADLVLLAFPLYIDSLPAPVIEALERIAAYRVDRKRTPRQLFTAISNSGFPEAHHNNPALAICETFARQAGFEWAGGLALGAGEGLVHGAPLNEAGGPATPIKKALEMAAAALAAGEHIPQAGIDLLAKSFVPGWLYRAIGWYGWKQQAKRWGAEKSLKRQPYAEAK